MLRESEVRVLTGDRRMLVLRHPARYERPREALMVARSVPPLVHDWPTAPAMSGIRPLPVLGQRMTTRAGGIVGPVDATI